MNLCLTEKKPTVGRPKQSALLREVKVKIWFYAVTEISGKTAYELEKEFAPPYIDRNEFGKQRARLWDKYRLGKTQPTLKQIEGGRRAIALLVEEKYPGTIRWLTSPLWKVLDLNQPVYIEEIRDAYEKLEPKLRSLFVLEGDQKNGITFWRKRCNEKSNFINGIAELHTADAYAALAIMWREFLITQKQEEFQEVCNVIELLMEQDLPSPFCLMFKILIFQYSPFWPIK